MAHSTPDAPTIETVNADTILVSVGSIDAGATHTDIYLTRTLPSVETEFLASHGLKANDPFTITDLDPGATYSVRAISWSAGDVSEFSDNTMVRLPRLFIYGHISKTAVGVTGVRVDVGYLPSPGRYFPSALIGGPWPLSSFDATTSIYRGVEVARMALQVTTMPSPKIRDGDYVAMTMSKPIGGYQERWTVILYDAIVREDEATYIPPAATDDVGQFFELGYFYDYFESGYFA